MKGKICLITGANSGIGYETALALAGMGAETILVCRDAQKGELAAEAIRRETSNRSVSVMICDFSSQASIRKLAEDFKQKYNQLHLLVNNAGAVNSRRITTEDGIEMTFAVNHLGYFLLTNLLLDILKSSAPSRIVNVASEAQNTPGYLNFDDLQNQQNYRAFFVYGQSKLCNVLFTYELAKRLAGTGVTANCLHPGVVATGFGSNAKGILGLLIKIARPFFISAQKGAQTIIYLSTSPEVEAVTGKYFIKCKERSSNRFSYDSTAAKRLWEISEELVNIRFHGENLSK